MPRHTLTLTLVAAFAASALAAPAALARPTDTLSPQARNAAATAASHRVASERVQDLRHLNAGSQIRTRPSTPGYTPGERRGREAYYSRAQPRSALQAEYYATSGTSPAGQRPATVVSTDDGAPWTTIALGLAAACVLLIAMLVARRARLRTHIAA
jgi:HAMP domain-containing protein